MQTGQSISPRPPVPPSTINYRNLLQEIIQQNHEELNRVLFFNVRNLSNAQYECELSYKGAMLSEGIVTIEKSPKQKLAIKLACKNMYNLFSTMIVSANETLNEDTLTRHNVYFINKNASNTSLKLLKYPSEKERIVINFELFTQYCGQLLEDLGYTENVVIINQGLSSDEDCVCKFYEHITDSFVTCDTEKIGEYHIIQLMNTFSPTMVPVIIIRKTPDIPPYVLKLFNNDKIVKIWCRTDPYAAHTIFDIQSYVKTKYTTTKTNTKCLTNNNNDDNNSDKSWESVPSLVDCCSTLSKVISIENLEKIRYIKSQFKAWHQQNLVPDLQSILLYSILDIVLITKCTQRIFSE